MLNIHQGAVGNCCVKIRSEALTTDTQQNVPVRVLEGVAALQILELDGGLGGTAGLLHDGEGQDLPGLSVNFDGEAILNVAGVDGHGKLRGRANRRHGEVVAGGGKGRGRGKERCEDRELHGDYYSTVWLNCLCANAMDGWSLE